MKKSIIEKRAIIKKTLIIVHTIITVTFLAIFYTLIFKLDRPLEASVSKKAKPSSHVILCGLAENERSLMRIYEGVREKALEENVVIDVYIPYSRSEFSEKEKFSIQKLLNFASYANADGILLWCPPSYTSSSDSGGSLSSVAPSPSVPSPTFSATVPHVDSSISTVIEEPPAPPAFTSPSRLKPPVLVPAVNKFGDKIPVVTLGSFLGEVQKVSHVTSDFSGEGKKFARRILDLYKNDCYVMVLNYFNSGIPEFREMQKSLFEELEANGVRDLLNFSFPPDSAKIELTRKIVEARGKNKVVVIVSLSEVDTVQAAQTINQIPAANVNSYSLNSDIHLFGFGKSDSELYYLEQGIIEELFMVDYIQNGRIALETLLEYKNNGISSEKVLIPFFTMKNEGGK